MSTTKKKLEELRRKVESINLEILRNLNERAKIAEKIKTIKQQLGLPLHDPEREQQMLQEIVEKNTGPFDNAFLVRIFKEIFRASLGHMESETRDQMIVSIKSDSVKSFFDVGLARIGKEKIVIAGPCAVESEEQMDKAAKGLSEIGIKILRGGAFKPRTSPYSFQGLGVEGLRILHEAARRYSMAVITEVMDTRMVEKVALWSDILQIGARNMYNYDLLREVGRAGKPVFLKRGLSATLDELLWSAEYIALEGERRIILCDRGVRTFTRETRNTLDISSVPVLKTMTKLPVFVDISHAAGRRDILCSLAAAALAAGADGIMVEVHPCPEVALSDSSQQLSIAQFGEMIENLRSRGLLPPLKSIVSLTAPTGKRERKIEEIFETGVES